MKNIIRILVLLVVCGIPLAAVAADKTGKEKAKSPMAAVIADKTGADFEAAYLGMMTLHHQSGAPMWALAREKSSNAEIKAMEQKTTPKEKREIEQMTAWLKQWHQKSPQDFQPPAESKKMMEKDMAELKAASGTEFDKLFAKKMARHHMGAIEMGKLGAEKAQHDKVKKSAKQIADSQSKDRKQLLGIAEAAK